MISQKDNVRNQQWGITGSVILAALVLAMPSSAKITPCAVAAGSLPSLQKCIDDAPQIGDATRTDTVIVSVPAGTYDGNTPKSQLRINHKKNIWIIGDTTADEATQPRILYQDRKHTYTDIDTGLRNDISPAGTYGQNNGTVWIYESDNIRLMGLLIDGNISTTSRTNTTGRIFSYGATLGNSAPVEIRGNVGVNILLSRNVQLRYLSVTNTWNGISIITPNLGGAFAFPDPNDPKEDVLATLPTSRAGRYGNHLVERCRIHDNTFGMLFQRDWDLSSVIRNNLFWGNYLRHWGDPKTPAGYVAFLETLDKGVRADGSKRSLAYTTVGGAFLMTDVALTPYRIHNNTFHNNATIFSGYYKTGTQHLFYNNLVGRPYQYFRSAINLQVQANASGGFDYGYTQTERNSEMLQYLSEHQRSNRVVDQDSIPANTAVTPNPWGQSGNLRLYNMRKIRNNRSLDDWTGDDNNRTWSNQDHVRDSLGMTWVQDTAALGTIAQQADTGGIVRWIRHNMWVGSAPDPHDPYPENWCPPWIPINIRKSLGNPKIFRNTAGFDVRWTLGLPIDTTSAVTSTSWLTPPLTSKLKMKGWSTYEGTDTDTLAIGAYDPKGGWAAPARRIVLRDTLIESVVGDLVKFRMNVAAQGIDDSDIAKLEVASAKFYNDVPVSDTLYNQGPSETGTGTTTRMNSVLSSKPWPEPYGFSKLDYNRAGAYSVDDSLTKKRLSPDNIFLGRISDATKWLHQDSLYARAEVVLKATLKSGVVVYSNPGVFMFSRPRFQFDVKVYDAITGDTLPLDKDGISRIAQAHQPLKVTIKARTVAKLPVPFKGYSWLQMGSAGGLHGTDGEQLQKQLTGTWSVRNPNDTVTPYFDTATTIIETLRANESPSDGTLKYSAIFTATDNSLLPYFIEGRSAPIKVVSGSIYQVTIDSVYRETTPILSPKYKVKMELNAKSAGRRDTLLQGSSDTSANVASVVKGETLRVLLQVRDKYGNEVRDSSSLKKGMYIRLAHVLAPGRYASAATDLNMVLIDSATTLQQSVRIAFDSLGRAWASIKISDISNRQTLAALRAAIIDSLGREIGTPGASRDSGVADTAWFKTDRASLVIKWVDTTGAAAFEPITDGWVGSWYPVRMKITKDLKSTLYTGSYPASALSPVYLHPALGDTSKLSSIVFAGDSLSAVVWIRANDSVTGAYIRAGQDSLSDSIPNLNFRYPSVATSAFYDRDCDGKIDSVVVKMNGPLSFRAPSGVVAGDSLDLKFPNQFLTPDAKGVPGRARLVSDSAMAFAWNPEAIGRADAAANTITFGNPLVPGKYVVYKLTALKDLAPPVAIAAFDKQTWTDGLMDSLVVEFSEAIDVAGFPKGSAPPFAVVRNGTRISMSTVKLARPAVSVADGKYAFVFTGATGLLLKGDSLVVEGTSVSDLVGNQSGTSCPNKVIPLDFSPKYEPSVGWVLDVDGDGNADSVHLGFKDSLGSIPQSILVKWGSPAETMTVTKAQLIALGVKTSDSTITVPTVNWNGKTVIIDGDTLYNRPRTVGPMDTAWFDGGLSREWLRDRVPPVVIHSRMKWGSDALLTGLISDTLTVDFSENVLGCVMGSDPTLCLNAKATISGQKFPAGSTILTAAGSRWTILVPRTPTSIKPKDSLQGTPAAKGGNLQDATVNVPGVNSPYTYVYGDPAPPRYGMMLDRNGDGRVDAVMLKYVATPLVPKLPPFTFEWSDSSGASVVLAADSSYSLDSTRWVAVLNTPGAFPVTGYPAASVKMIGKQHSGSMIYPFPVRDSAGPVLKPLATLRANSDKSGYDTVVVWPSEALRDPVGSVLLEFRRSGVVVATNEVSFKSAVRQTDGSWKVIVGPNGYRPMAGDETRLSTSGSVTDTVVALNIPSPSHPWVPLSGNLRTPYASAYLDANKDGRIETATFDFASPVSIGTRIRVFDPAGTTTYREYVVSASDTGKTRLEFDFSSSPWGVDVTSLIKSDLGLMVAATGLDSNLYRSGRFNISDKVEPVITGAKLRYTSDTSSVDTLVLKVSEWVGVDLTKYVLRYRPSSDLSDTGVAILPDPRYKAIYDSVNGTLTLYLNPFPTGYSNPARGDSLRLSWDGVVDRYGNAPETKAKWTQVLANERVFPPRVKVSNNIVESEGKSGELIPGNQIEVVGRGTTTDGRQVWSSYEGGTWKAGTSTYTPGMGPNGPGTGSAKDAFGTVVFIQTNVPTTIKVYIYDIVGTYVGKVTQYISKEMLDRLAKTSGSRTGMVDVGVLWKGQREDGRLVASGIYPIRLLALREPVEEEKASGKVNNSIYNRLVNVGVKLRLK